MKRSAKLPQCIEPKIANEVLIKNHKDLSSLICNCLLSLKDRLISVGLIPRILTVTNSVPKEEVAALLNCVHDKIESSPNDFTRFVSELESELYLKDLAEHLVTDYLNLCSPVLDSCSNSAQSEVKPQDGEDILPNISSSQADTKSCDLKSLDSPNKQLELNNPDNKSYDLIMPKGQELRKYQAELAQPGILGENYIIVAPTGSGKTTVAALIISEHLKKKRHHAHFHVIFLVQNRILAEQQAEKLGGYIPDAEVEFCVGDKDLAVFDSIKYNDITVCTAGKILNEIDDGLINFDHISLLVIDECHHTVGQQSSGTGWHNYAQVMYSYFQYQEKQGHHIQIIGMTTSPGAGKNPNITEERTISHLKDLMGLLNATAGIVTVTENVDELRKFSPMSTFNHKFVKSREIEDDPVIAVITDEMDKLEHFIPEGKIYANKLSGKYHSQLTYLKKQYEDSEDKSARDTISTLTLLNGYYTALHYYMDLPQSNAIEVIEANTDISYDDSIATPHEREIRDRKDTLLKKLHSIDPCNNRFLDKMKELLWDTQKKEPKFSRGMVFVHTKRYAYSLCDWVSEDPDVKVKVKAAVLTGHTDSRMTQDKQKFIMEEFRKGKYNLVISTSVAEEGIDVAECNLVIRYHYVSSDIAKRQVEGRLRAENSQGFTILASDSKKKYKDLRNEELNELVDKILKKGMLPVGDCLKKEILDIQHEFKEKQKQAAAQKSIQIRNNQGSDVKLYCKKCKEFACSGSDIYKVHNHHIVPSPEFEEKFKVIEHSKEGSSAISPKITKKDKMKCKTCNRDWGITCHFKDYGCDFPLLKCEHFNFKVDGRKQDWKQWKNVTFEIQPLSIWVDERINSQSSDD